MSCGAGEITGSTGESVWFVIGQAGNLRGATTMLPALWHATRRLEQRLVAHLLRGWLINMLHKHAYAYACMYICLFITGTSRFVCYRK